MAILRQNCVIRLTKKQRTGEKRLRAFTTFSDFSGQAILLLENLRFCFVKLSENHGSDDILETAIGIDKLV